jgi:hypothetical protein
MPLEGIDARFVPLSLELLACSRHGRRQTLDSRSVWLSEVHCLVPKLKIKSKPPYASRTYDVRVCACGCVLWIRPLQNNVRY